MFYFLPVDNMFIYFCMVSLVFDFCMLSMFIYFCMVSMIFGFLFLYLLVSPYWE